MVEALRPLSERELAEVRRLCARYDVSSLALFGSALGNRFDPVRSDVDLLVRFGTMSPLGKADQYFGLKEALEDLLKRPVDLVVADAVRNPFFRQELAETAKEIYAT